MKQILQNLRTGEIELAEVPEPALQDGSVLIQSVRSLISLGTERMLIQFGRAGLIEKARKQPEKVKQVLQKVKTDGLFPTLEVVMKKLEQPLPLGYSNVGVVRAVGAGVRALKIGDRVVSNGNHAEIVCVQENLCAKIPDSVDDATASFSVVAAIALHGVRLVNPTLGETVAVIGLGLIGQLACQILVANGCRVIGYDLDADKVSIVKKMGVLAYAMNGEVDPVAISQGLSNDQGVDAVIIAASTKSNDPVRVAAKMCRKRGRIVLVGVVGLDLLRDDFYKKEISFQVSCSYGPGRYEHDYEKKGLDYPIGYVRWTEQRNFDAVLQLMAAGKIKTEDLVSAIVPFIDALKAYEMVATDNKSLGIVLEYPNNTCGQERSVKLIHECERMPSNGKIVIGFIGAGNFSISTLIPSFKKCNVRFKSIACVNGVSGTRVGRKYGFEEATTDVNTIWDDPEINTVVIATPHNTHARYVLAAMQKGKNVFVEKPLCITREELTNIAHAYAESSVEKRGIIMVDFNRRFSPFTQKMKSLMSNVPEPKNVIMTVNAGFIPNNHWVQDKNVGGGRIIGEACHFIDLLRYLVGSKIVSVHADAMEDRSCAGRAIDSVAIVLRFDDGSLGTIHYLSNGHKAFPKERLDVFCGGRVLQIDNFRRMTGCGWHCFKKMSAWKQNKGHAECASAFIDAIKNEKQSPIAFSELTEVMQAVLEAASLLNQKA